MRLWENMEKEKGGRKKRAERENRQQMQGPKASGLECSEMPFLAEGGLTAIQSMP